MIGPIDAKVIYTHNAARLMLLELAREAAAAGQKVSIEDHWDCANWWTKVKIEGPEA